MRLKGSETDPLPNDLATLERRLTKQTSGRTLTSLRDIPFQNDVSDDSVAPSDVAVLPPLSSCRHICVHNVNIQKDNQEKDTNSCVSSAWR